MHAEQCCSASGTVLAGDASSVPGPVPTSAQSLRLSSRCVLPHSQAPQTAVAQTSRDPPLGGAWRGGSSRLMRCQLGWLSWGRGTFSNVARARARQAVPALARELGRGRRPRSPPYSGFLAAWRLVPESERPQSRTWKLPALRSGPGSRHGVTPVASTVTAATQARGKESQGRGSRSLRSDLFNLSPEA